MIKTPTVLILGAGASCPYGFPSGQELCDKIREITSNSEIEEYRILRSIGFEEDTIQAFSATLLISRTPSIDAFLEQNEKYVDIGKHAIAAALFPNENYNNLLGMIGGEYWYDYLYHRLISGSNIDDFSQNQLNVITFNYDRSLEIFLHRALIGFYGRSEEETRKLLSNIHILHVYGSLGPLPWQTNDAKAIINYNGKISEKRIVECAKNIKTIHEASEDTGDITLARELLKNARRIYFLGFGYHQENLDILRIQDLDHNRDIMGTVYKLPNTEKRYFFNLLINIYGREDHKMIENCLHDEVVIDFLQKHSLLN